MLLHDIGHYPLSHATEKAAEKYYKNSTVRTEDVLNVAGATYLDHERVGAGVLVADEEVSKILSDSNFDPNRIGRIFGGKEDSYLKNLVKSELDADRLDYLMRSSQATGLPYGNYDRDYIIQNLSFDSGEKICLRAKALRAADHFLICRTFDYLQTIFHKTIVGFEQMLQHCVLGALESGLFSFSDDALKKAISSGEWLAWDDAWLWGKLRDLEKGEDQKIVTMAKRLRERTPADCIFSVERVTDEGEEAKREIEALFEKIKDDPELKENIITWVKKFSPTDVSPSRKTGLDTEDEEAEKEMIRILSTDNGSSKPLIRCENSLIKALREQSYVFGRVYFVGKLDKLEETRKRLNSLLSTYS